MRRMCEHCGKTIRGASDIDTYCSEDCMSAHEYEKKHGQECSRQ